MLRFQPGPLPNPETLDAVAVHASFREQSPEALDTLFAQLPEDVRLVEADRDALQRLIAGLRRDRDARRRRVGGARR